MSKKSYDKPMNNNKIVFLVWDRQSIRAAGIAKHIGASIHFLFTSRIRHPMLFIRTLQILRNERPRVIICQSPPITCAFIAMVYKHIFARMLKPKVLIDAHTGAITRPWCKIVSRFVMKHASANIVINDEQQNYLIQNYHIRPIVLEDPIPDFTDILYSKQEEYKIDKKALFNVAVISSFAYDEPLQAVLDAASELPDVYFYITGDKKNADEILLIKKSDNVILTGFLDYDIYIDLLQKVGVIMDLTTENTSIVAGGFEAVALEQPLIISNWLPLRRYFNKGTIYINNTSDEIKKAITVAMTKKGELSKEMTQLKIEKLKEWQEKMSYFYHVFH
jgi:hypothetical protein